MPKLVQPINPPTLAKPVGYSHAWETQGGKTVYIAGQVAFDKEGKVVGPGDVVAQFRQVCENLKAVVEAQGGTMQDIVKLNLFTTDRDTYMDNRPALGLIYREYFGRHYPAMTLVEVKGLWDQTGVTCGVPSGMRVARWAKGAFWKRSRNSAGMGPAGGCWARQAS